MSARVLAAMLVVVATSSAVAQAPAAEETETTHEVQRRERMRRWHIAFGNLAWAAANASTILGIIQYRDRYGAFDDGADTPCARGDAIVESACDGTPVPHAIAVTSLLSFFTAALSIGMAMPDPLRASEGPSRYARRLRRHKTIRWVLLGMMVVQTALGAISANLDSYSARRSMATVHLGLGVATWATMTTMGIYGSLMAY